MQEQNPIERDSHSFRRAVVGIVGGAAAVGAAAMINSAPAGAETPAPTPGVTQTEVPRTSVNPGDPNHADVIIVNPPTSVKAPEHGDPIYVAPAPKVEAKQANPSDTTVTSMEKTVPVVVAPKASVEAPTSPTTEATPNLIVPNEAPVATSGEVNHASGNTLLGDIGGGLAIAGGAALVANEAKKQIEKH